MTAIEDGFVSTGENGFLIKQDHGDAANISSIRSQGGANLGGLQNEPTHREIDWLVFRKVLKGDRRSDRMATLIYPFASTKGTVPADVSVESLDLKDKAAIGYRVKMKDREDLVILSDGTSRGFTEKIAGDFTYARISSAAGVVDYAGFTGVARFTIDGVTGQSFTTRRDYEYQK